ncbi:MAG: threonine synthase [Candidatus Izemoplasmatales bacterium]|nr:threonine synthase [Candidatus Izemoplasmatales bacterium]
MNYVLGYRCTLCDEFFPNDKDMFVCPHCGDKGILDIEYDYLKIKKVFNKHSLLKNHNYSIWRYLPLLPVEEEFTKKTLKVGWTPLLRSNHLENKYQSKALYFKDDGMNPTQSLKDRASVIACVKALELNKTIIACSSTGNAASSLAGNASRLGLKTVIFVPKRAPLGKLAQLLAFGATVIKVEGDYKAAYNLSKDAIEHFSWYNRNAGINPNLIEGKKTVVLEIAEQLDFKPTDWVIVSVGDGCTIGGVYKGFYDLFKLGMIAHIPKIIGVQSEGCSPFYDAFNEERELVEVEENTIADSIAVGIPRNPVKGLKAVTNSKGTYIAVSDDEIMEAMKELGSFEGIFAEPAAAASYAGYKKARNLNVITSLETVTVIITGNGLKDTANALNYLEEPILLGDNLEDLKRYIIDKKEGLN